MTLVTLLLVIGVTHARTHITGITSGNVTSVTRARGVQAARPADAVPLTACPATALLISRQRFSEGEAGKHAANGLRVMSYFLDLLLSALSS